MKHLRSDYDRIQDTEGIIPDDEPVFVLRGQDLAAPAAVRAWADKAEELGADPDLVERVRGWADEMEDYSTGIPDTPEDALR